VTGSAVIDTAIGLVFVFLAGSLFCTGVLEWISNKLNKRGEYLLRGLRELLDLPPATPEAPQSQGTPATGSTLDLLALKTRKARRGTLQKLSEQGDTLRTMLATDAAPKSVQPPAYLADLVLSHPLVAGLHRPAKPGSLNGNMHLASYLSGRTFAASLIDLLVPNGLGQTTIKELESHVGKLDSRVPARDALLAILRDADNSIENFRTGVESWYDEQMARVSGWYKRWAQWRLLIAGLLLAVFVNVDTLQVGYALYHDQPVRDAVVAQALSAQACPSGSDAASVKCRLDQKAVLEKLSLPLGWGFTAAGKSCKAYSRGHDCNLNPVRWIPFAWHSATARGAHSLLKLLGWLLTGLAVAQGAPFWFDALGKLGSLRTAGRRPAVSNPS